MRVKCHINMSLKIYTFLNGFFSSSFRLLVGVIGYIFLVGVLLQKPFYTFIVLFIICFINALFVLLH